MIGRNSAPTSEEKRLLISFLLLLLLRLLLAADVLCDILRRRDDGLGGGSNDDDVLNDLNDSSSSFLSLSEPIINPQSQLLSSANADGKRLLCFLGTYVFAFGATLLSDVVPGGSSFADVMLGR